MSVEQTGTVADYRREFVTRLTYLDPVEEGVMLGAFLRGLHPDIKAELKILGPTTLEQAMTCSWLGRRHVCAELPICPS